MDSFLPERLTAPRGITGAFFSFWSHIIIKVFHCLFMTVLLQSFMEQAAHFSHKTTATTVVALKGQQQGDAEGLQRLPEGLARLSPNSKLNFI